MEMMRRFAAFLLALGWALALSACGGPAGGLPGSGISPPPSAAQTDRGTQSPDPAPEDAAPETPEDAAPAVSEDGWYDSKEEVALYIHLYGHLPGNYLTAGTASRGAERLVFSTDGRVYYPGDHYESFELLYGEP